MPRYTDDEAAYFVGWFHVGIPVPMYIGKLVRRVRALNPNLFVPSLSATPFKFGRWASTQAGA